LFIGAAGEVKVSVNIGGAIFRAVHEELGKGIIGGMEGSSSYVPAVLSPKNAG